MQQRLSEVLRCQTLFGQASEALLGDLETLPPVRMVSGGEEICRQGAVSDCLMIILTGSVRPSLTGPKGVQLLPPIGPGQTVGELGVILDQPRSATLTAARDSELLVISKADTHHLLRRHPEELNRLFCSSLYHHLAPGLRAGAASRARSVAVFALAPQDAEACVLAKQVADDLAQALAFVGKVGVVGMASAGPQGARSAAHFHQLEQAVDLLIYVTDAPDPAWRQRCIRQADHVLMIARHDDPASPYPDEERLYRDPGLAMKDKSLLLLQPAQAERPQGSARWRADRPGVAIWHLRPGHRGDAGRVARRVVGQARGVVLGGGGARGFAHLGVLKALADAQMPVDMIGGNSMGALIGAQFAQGKPLPQILDDTRRFARGGEFPTVPLISLFSGYRVRRDLQRMFAGWDLEDTWVPFFSVSCNLSTASVEVHDRGPMARAVLASNSPAGLLPPMVQHGHLLVDGAVLNNVPVDVMRQRLGAGHLIAVDVNIREDLTVDPALDRLSPWDAVRRWFLRDRRLPGLGEILVRAGIVGGIAHRDRVRDLADLYIEPKVSHFPMIAYGQAEAIAAQGERDALFVLGKETNT
jgi:NTE family protein/lysophospholipid hydrolase